MIPRGYSMFVMLLLGSLLGIVLLNIYVIKPNLSTTPAAAPVFEPQPAEVVDSLKIADKIITKSTEQAIREIDSQLAPERGEGLVREHANPFSWPEELALVIEKERMAMANQDQGLHQEKEQELREELELRQQMEQQRPKLNMVIIGEKRKLALLDDTFVYEGDKFRENMIVQQINAEEVVLLTDIEEIRIPLVDVSVIVPAELEQAVAELEESEAQSVPGQQRPAGPDSQQQSVQQQVDMINTLFEQLKPFLQEGK